VGGGLVGGPLWGVGVGSQRQDARAEKGRRCSGGEVVVARILVRVGKEVV